VIFGQQVPGLDSGVKNTIDGEIVTRRSQVRRANNAAYQPQRARGTSLGKLNREEQRMSRGRRKSYRAAFIGAGLGILMAASAALPGTGALAATVGTTTGTFTGVPSPTLSDVSVFFGIRYAAPPEGNLRWTPPQSPTPPSGTVLASTPGPACPQNASTAPLPQSEDCLFLNVYVPPGATPSSHLPVFIWIHGGALVTGTGAQYDPSVMVAENNIIVVTINYRLGALGWLSEPGLHAITPSFFQNPGDAGNYGLMDQQFTMQWVQANIAGFGGDPTKVTIGGESAGGLSVSSNLESLQTAGGLFRSAIIESGGYMLHDLPAEEIYEAIFGPGFDAALGCTPPADAACLRSQSVSAILAAQTAAFGANGISPDFATKVLPFSLDVAFEAGLTFHVPVLQGTNANEGRLFEPLIFPFPAAPVAQVFAAGGPATFDLANPNTFCATPQGTGTPVDCTYPQEINLFLALNGFPAAANTSTFDNTLAQEYPLANFPDPFTGNSPNADEALSQIFTDLVFACNGSDSNTDLSTFTPVFAYEFNDPQAPPTVGFGAVVIPPNDVFGFPSASEHASELQFLFNFGTTLNAGEQQLAEEMKTYWGNFVNTGNPNTPRLTSTWLPFSAGNMAVQDLVPGPTDPSPFFTFRTEHFCDTTWEPILEVEEEQ
jgi:para-nitrobenzyl esterase